MNRSQYVYLLLVVVNNFFNLRFMPHIGYGSDESLLLLMGVIVFGLIYYKLDNSLCSEPIVKQYTTYLKYVWVTIGISVFTCYLFWNQSLFQSFLTYRRLFTYVLFFALLWIKPSVDEIINGLKYYTYTFLFIAFCVWVLHIPMTHTIYRQSAELAENNAILGTTFVAFYFYHLLTRLRNEFNWKDLLIVSLLLLYFIVNQNRSLMFPCLIFYLYTIYKIRTGFILKSLLIFGICLGLFYNFNLIQNLISETQTQFDDESYVRWEAITYFLTDHSPNIVCVIFGNGIISVISNPTLWLMLYSNMWNFNDIGWFGYYAFFGLAGIIAVFNIILRIILDKYSHLDIRMLLIHMCVPTIWALWLPDIICMFCLIIYIYIYRKVYATDDKVEKYV